MKLRRLSVFVLLVSLYVASISAQGPRIRANVTRLTPTQLESLKRGVSVMKSRAPDDPTSWQFQANIHGVSVGVTHPLFAQCQHGTLHFFTWHRAYLHFFERILRQASGDPSLQLPYWDWSTSRAVPLAFREQTTPANPLFHARSLNNGALLPRSVVVTDRNNALNQDAFADFSSLLEGSPHGNVHTMVGGMNGDMSRIARSANDPIFWLHHCNIDRLWDMWLNSTNHTNPSNAAFLDRQFRFASETGQTVTVRVRDIMDSRTLGYRYDDVPNPTPPTESLAAPREHLTASHGLALADERPHSAESPQPRRARRLVATSRPVGTTEAGPAPAIKLEFAAKSVQLKTVAGPATETVAPSGRTFLEIHGLQATAPPPFTYGIYIGLPEDENNEERREEYYVGSLNFFGIASDDQHGHEAAVGNQRVQEFDVTKLVARLKEKRVWDPAKINVSIVPIAPVADREDEAAARQASTQAAANANIRFDRIELRVEGSASAPETRVSTHEATPLPAGNARRFPRRVGLPKPPTRPGMMGIAAAPGPNLLETAPGQTTLDLLLESRRQLAKELELLDARLAKLQETICGGTTDFQDVERYDGLLGVTVDFVRQVGPTVGQLQWVRDLPDRFTGLNDSPGNVNAVRWGTGGLIARDLFLTAGHCFDQDAGGWDMPQRNGQVISSSEIARLMNVNFGYQVDSTTGRIRSAVVYPVVELVEYRRGNLDYALVRLGQNSNGQLPGDVHGVLTLANTDAANRETLCLIQHPNGMPKKIHAGPLRDVIGNEISYASLDTLGGSSGSPLLAATGNIVGVHTNGGCFEDGGFNFGVSITAIRRASQAAPLAITETTPSSPTAGQGQ